MSPIENLEPVKPEQHLLELTQEQNVFAPEPQDLENKSEDIGVDLNCESTYLHLEEHDDIGFDDECNFLESESNYCFENSTCFKAKDIRKEINVTGNERLLIGSRIMFPISNIRIENVLEMIVAFSTRYSVTLEGRSKLFEMFKICSGPETSTISTFQIICCPKFSIHQKM